MILAEGVNPPNEHPTQNETVTVGLGLGDLGERQRLEPRRDPATDWRRDRSQRPASDGVVVAGGPSIARSVHFTASGTCGSNITLTLALPDGAAISARFPTRSRSESSCRFPSRTLTA